MKILIILYLFYSFLNAKDTLVVQQQNVLYVQNLIEVEEKIASNFEKYLLEKFEVPTLDKLKIDEYLGSNFTSTNKFGSNIDFVSGENLKIKYAITQENLQLYVTALYERDLYRDMTTVYKDKDTLSNSYVSFELKSKVAENILEILETGSTITSDCDAPLKESYCITNLNTIRWYDVNLNWIEYNNEDFEEGNVTVSTSGLLSSVKLDKLNVGTFIFVNNSGKYIKTVTDIVKVD